MASQIQFVNRSTGKIESEKVLGEGAIRLAYENPVGQWITENILSRSALSHLYGMYQNTAMSAGYIPKFIQDYSIPMDQYEAGPFANFNEFFIRKFKPGKRPFESNPTGMAAFAEARYLAFESIQPNDTFPVKGEHLTSTALLAGHPRSQAFREGPLLLARLCPVDYHRYHYPDEGTTVESFRIHGKYHSVNPTAIQADGTIFARNERQVSFLQTKNFGLLAYIEVGALCVGKIVQSHSEKSPFQRGDEKGYFLFGGSTVIVLGEKGAWKPDADLLENTAKKLETWVKLGEKVASAPIR